MAQADSADRPGKGRMDKIDRKILAELERDAKQPLVALSETIGLSKTPCWARVQELERSGAILGYHAELSPPALGLVVTAYIEVVIESSRRAEFEEAAIRSPVVIECLTMAGAADYMIKIHCRDVAQLDSILRYDLTLLPGVQHTKTTICLKSIKTGGSLAEAAAALAAQ
ncbi:transcriptional regulator, AsnC family [Rhizorhabdus wittichii RW1]|uniref:Transcriptional regulator, AsnC family n=2 Tax=Rhizorhabdus wittichii TaxID=160791 RepID=A0A9J9H9A3_RHIWR|nr:transcriptional regulator, AsnC family [Rhizorhabdus wittichii RW1]